MELVALEDRANVLAARGRVAGLLAPDAVAFIALGSLFVSSERYPAVLTVDSATIRAQDVLFALLLALWVPRILHEASRAITIAAALAGFLICLIASAMHSPLGSSAVIAVLKYAEFVFAGIALGLFLRHTARPELVTGILAAGIVATASAALVSLLSASGPSAVLHERSGGLLSFEAAMAAAAMTGIWFAVRLTRRESDRERNIALVGLAAAATTVVLAKSVLVVGLALALIALAPFLRSRWLGRVAIVVVLLIAVAAVGRASDIRSVMGAGGLDERSAVALARPAAGTPPALPAPYVRRHESNLTGGSFAHRIALAYLGLRIAVESPALGHGWLSTTQPEFLSSGPFDRYMLERFPRLDPNLLVSNYLAGSHNAYLQTIAEAGVLAGVLLVTLIVLALLPALATVWRYRSVAPWQVACGAGWLIVIVVFLASSMLFGGQFETCLLGLSLALCSGAFRRDVPRRAWLAAVGSVLAVAAACAAVLAIPIDRGDASPLARVIAVDGTGHEVFKAGTGLGSPGDAVLSNGVIDTRVRDDEVVVRPHDGVSARPGAWQSAARVPSLGQARQVVVGRRSADAVSLVFIDAHARPRLELTLARGLPGVYVTLPDGERVSLDGTRGVAIGARLSYAESPVVRLKRRLVPELVPVVATRAEDAAVVVPTSTTRVSFAGRTLSARPVSPAHALFLGFYAFDRSRGDSVARGAYAYRISH